MLYVVRAVREREPFVKEILKQVPEAVVYWDDEHHDAMKSYLHVCKNVVKGSRAVLLEDDVVLTSNFKEKIEAVISNYPESLIKFFDLGRKNKTPHFKKGKEYCSNLCEYFPKGFSSEVLKKYDAWKKFDGGKNPTAYDYLVGYAWGRDVPFLTWCPSLVQHREGKSVIDSRRSSKRQSTTFEP